MAKWATVAAVSILGIVVLQRSALEAQAPRTNPPDGTLATLVSEIRGLRADLAAANQRTLRAQLLLGRLQMQEQRIAYLDKQRADAVQRSNEVQGAIAGMSAQFGGDLPNCNGKNMPREQCEAMIKALKPQLDAMTAQGQQLRQQSLEAENALATEQARWADFNAQLDQLERSLR